MQLKKMSMEAPLAKETFVERNRKMLFWVLVIFIIVVVASVIATTVTLGKTCFYNHGLRINVRQVIWESKFIKIPDTPPIITKDLEDFTIFFQQKFI